MLCSQLILIMIITILIVIIMQGGGGTFIPPGPTSDPRRPAGGRGAPGERAIGATHRDPNPRNHI